MAKHACAVYFDQQGRRHIIKTEELVDPYKLQEARSHALLDAEEEFRMSVRGGKSPHFFALATNGRTLTDVRKEADPAHNERIAKLLKMLNDLPAGETIELGTNAWNEETNASEWAPFVDIKDYTWAHEVTRALSEDGKCRHDLFGMTKGLSLSGRFPWVAIEVIHHHFPNKRTLQGLLDLTRLMPLVVLFDLVSVPNYFMRIDMEKKQIRSIFYLYRGRVWRNDKMLEEDMTAQKLEAAMKKLLEAKRQKA